MIPKIIHYCWYGQNEIPEDIKYYIDTLKKNFPDYKIICWNENNTNLNENKYLKQAYDAVLVDTSDMDIDQVVDVISSIIQEKMKA